MAQPHKSKKDIEKCVRCKEPLTTFMAYIPGEGDVCLQCFKNYAQDLDNLLVTRAKK